MKSFAHRLRPSPQILIYCAPKVWSCYPRYRAATAFENAAHRIVGEALSVKSFTGLELKFAMNAKLAATTHKTSLTHLHFYAVSVRTSTSPCFGRIESVKNLCFMMGIKSITLNDDQNHIFLSYYLPKYQQSHQRFRFSCLFFSK